MIVTSTVNGLQINVPGNDKGPLFKALAHKNHNKTLDVKPGQLPSKQVAEAAKAKAAKAKAAKAAPEAENLA